MLNAVVLGAAQRGDWPAVAVLLFMDGNASIDLTEVSLNAASAGNWNTVFLCLEINKRSQRAVIDLKARHRTHPEGWRLFDYAKGKIIRHSQNGSQRLDTLLMTKYNVQPSYDLEVFRFARAGDWVQVFNHLNLNKQLNNSLIDLNARDEFHPERWRLFDYAEAADPELVLQLWSYGARPSYDIKLFSAVRKDDWNRVFELIDKKLVGIDLVDESDPKKRTLLDYAIPAFFNAARTGDWNSVFRLIDRGFVNVNLVDEADPLKRTVLNHALTTGNYVAINGLMIDRSAKETHYDPSTQEPILPLLAPANIYTPLPLPPLEAMGSVGQIESELSAQVSPFVPAYQARRLAPGSTLHAPQAIRQIRIASIGDIEQSIEQPVKKKNPRRRRNPNDGSSITLF